jgi:hypothetical protein
MANFNPATQRCDVSWEKVEAPLVAPRARTYGKKDAGAAKASAIAQAPAGDLSGAGAR